MKQYRSLILLCFVVYANIINSSKIAFCITATNRYDHFALNFIQSCRAHFLKNHAVTYFIFSDKSFEPANDLVVIPIKHESWPFGTLKRFEHYYDARSLLESFDYIFAADADMLFVNDVDDSILSERVAVLHPYQSLLPRAKYTFDTNPQSRAYIAISEGEHYFAGGFYGGTHDEFLKLVKTTSENINIDLAQGYIALWHDESHLNRYFIDNPPTLALPSSYCYPSQEKDASAQFLLALVKDHASYHQ